MTPPSNNPEIDQKQLAGKLEGILSSRRRRKPLFADLPASSPISSPNQKVSKATESAGAHFNIRELIKSIPWIGAIAVRVYRRLRRLRQFQIQQFHELAADERIDRIEPGAAIPLLIDLKHRCRSPLDLRAADAYWNKVNLLFVGPVDESNHQWQLVDILHELRYFSDRQVRLILAGSIISDCYKQRLEARIAELGLQDSVEFAGEVPHDALLALYRSADAFVCMSGHKGFGMSLIEAMLMAMLCDVPVIAYGVGGIPDTMGEGGLVSPDGSPRAIAALTHLLLSEPALRRKVIAGQRRNLRRFEVSRLQAGPAAPCQWLIEGPFDSSYSLAIVNREVGRALVKRGIDVGLWSTDGPSDTRFLENNPDCAQLARHAAEAVEPPKVSLRFCYPPRVDGMQGEVRGMHSYGWEESGFPDAYAVAFNTKLDLITVLSRHVEKILRDAGVSVPIAVTGSGVNPLLQVQPQAPAAGLREFRFLHVSSCFPRKGVDALLSAYGDAFSDADSVTLIIKTFPNPHNDVAQQIARLKEQRPDYPDVVLIDRDCSEEELAGLYRHAHAFVAPSKGEGFGLPLAEAMLFDLPVITTAWGGQTDFCDDSTAWMCDYRFARSGSHLGAAHSVWADPDIGDLARLLREVQAMSPAQRAPRVVAARRRVESDCTWDGVAQKIEAAVGALAARPLFRREPKVGWVSTWNTRCGIARYSAFLSVAFPADRLVVLANRTDERVAEEEPQTVRCWNTHPDENLDNAFDAVQANGIGAVVIQYHFDFFSLETLARFIERLKQAGVAVHCFFHSTAESIRDGKKLALSNIAPALALADRLYVHAVEDMNRLKGCGLVDNLVFFPHGVMPQTAPDANMRALLGTVGKKVIASYGFLRPHKGIQQLIHAFSILAKENPALHLLLVTSLYPYIDSEQEEIACKALIEQYELTGKVTLLTDFLSDEQSLAYLGSADLIVFPYQQTQESSSAAVRMGLAAGRPVAVTPLTIFDDVIEAVHVLPGTDPTSIAQGARAILNDAQALAQQSEKAERWCASRRWGPLSVRFLNLIDGLANSTRY
jgi:glycosyltransferase involved in cell wall biosynthesis